jgi:ABC-type polysaccharide/polyol phosphate export permease
MADIALTRFSYFQQMWRLRYFWMSLVCNDIVNRYRRSFLGVGWSLLRPLSMTFVFCVVFGALFNQPTTEYAPFLMVSMAVWQFMHESMSAGCNTFINSAAYIRQQRVPLAIFPLRTVLGTGFHFLIAFTLALGMTLYFKGIGDPLVALAAIPAMVLIFLFAWAAATVLGLVQTHFPDCAQLYEIGMQILFYLTPVVYKTELFPQRRKLLLLLNCNPCYSLLELVRRPILDGMLPPVTNVAIAVGFVAMVVLLAWVCLRKLERNLVFWV